MTESQQFWKTITEIVLIITVILLSLYDSFVMYHCGRVSTITDVVYTHSRNWPVIPLFIGLIVGHMLWR